MSKKLLLADDSLTIQKVVGIVFANLDYQLLIADNGEAALEIARKEFPDLVIADIGMPGMDGLELCRTIKGDSGLASIPVMLLPGAFENFDEGAATDAGASGWLTKPFESQTLINKVEALLAAAPESAEPVAPISEPEPVVDDIPELEPEPAPIELEEATEAAEPEPVVADEPISLDAPEEEEPATADDDIWDAVTFDEEDLQADATEKAEEPLAAVPETDDVAAELPVVEDTAIQFEDPAPIAEEPSTVLAEPEEEVLELAEDDIIELDDEAIIEETPEVAESELSEPVDFSTEPEEQLEPDVPGPIDFSAPEPVAEPEPEPEPEFVSPFEVEPQSTSMDETILEEEQAPEVVEEVAEVEEVEPVLASVPDSAGEPELSTEVASAEEQLRNLDDSELETVVRKVAGPLIEKLASEMLEQVVWEVVPDLAESMIKDEIRKIKEGAA